ncbi:MAG: hypothetical protein AAB759_00960 [Patescibacteria group bacterium]
MTNATFPQAKHLIEVFETLGSGRLQALFASGLLIDLRRCAAELDPTKVNRDEFQRILGLDPTLFRVKMGGSNNTDQITAALGFAFNEWITRANFPLTPSATPWEDEIEIVDPGCSFTEEEGLKILKDKGLERPTYEHGIRFAEQHGKTTTSEKKPFVIFLHEAWLDPDRDRRIVYLDRRAEDRGLYLDDPDRRFRGFCVLAGVRPRKQPQS